MPQPSKADVENLERDRGATVRADICLSMAGPMRDDSVVLDIGCGLGTLLAQLGSGSRFGLELLAEAARAAARFAPVARGDLERDGLPFKSAVADVVFMTEVLEHLFDPLAAVHEVARVLKPDKGLAVLSVPNEYRLMQRLRMLLGRPVSDPLKRGGHIKFFSAASFVSLLHSGGLRVVRMEPVGLLSMGRLGSGLVRLAPGLFAKWLFVVCAATNGEGL